MNQDWKIEYDKHCNSCELCLQEAGEDNLANCIIYGIMIGYQKCCKKCIELDHRINWTMPKENKNEKQI